MSLLEELFSGKLAGSSSLKLSANLSEVPAPIFDLAESLEILDLSKNNISDLPQEFSKLKKLKILFLSDNKFTSVPEILSECSNLEMVGFKANQIAEFPENSLPHKIRWLILTNNKITKLPNSIGKWTKLQKVMFAGNLLTELPDEMANCTNIELLRISANRLTNIPDWLLRLPKLSWLAFAGNPFTYKPDFQNQLIEEDLSNYVLEEKLGEGASGIIYKAISQKNYEEIAIKIFKGEVTSDGLPEDEMLACIAAGPHPNLVEVKGKIKEEIGTKGLIFKLIPKGFKNLGDSPSFESCTRDVFKEQTKFTAKEIIKILLGVASVGNQIHSKGISHGDLYAHNILINQEAEPLFGDFGAGAFYDKRNFDQAESIEKK